MFSKLANYKMKTQKLITFLFMKYEKIDYNNLHSLPTLYNKIFMMVLKVFHNVLIALLSRDEA